MDMKDVSDWASRQASGGGGEGAAAPGVDEAAAAETESEDEPVDAKKALEDMSKGMKELADKVGGEEVHKDLADKLRSMADEVDDLVAQFEDEEAEEVDDDEPDEDNTDDEDDEEVGETD